VLAEPVVPRVHLIHHPRHHRVVRQSSYPLRHLQLRQRVQPISSTSRPHPAALRLRIIQLAQHLHDGQQRQRARQRQAFPPHDDHFSSRRPASPPRQAGSCPPRIPDHEHHTGMPAERASSRSRPANAAGPATPPAHQPQGVQVNAPASPRRQQPRYRTGHLPELVQAPPNDHSGATSIDRPYRLGLRHIAGSARVIPDRRCHLQ